jgi:hypothetical protein
VAYTDSLRRVWFGYEQNKIVLLEGDHVRSFAAAQGVKAGNITAVCEKDGEVWVGGTSGLQRFAEGRFQTVTAASGTFEAVSGIVERSNGDLWLNQNSGVLRISHEEIEKFKTDSQYPVQADTFNTLDGMPGAPNPSSRLPSAVESPDGSLWFSTSSGLVWIDPDDIPVNRLVPTVLIQSVTADDKTYREPKQLSFPNRLQNLAIRYTALSLSMPERVRFRYMLEGFDSNWQEARSVLFAVTAGKLSIPYRRLQQRRRLEPCGKHLRVQRRPGLLSENLVQSSHRRFHIAAIERLV